MKSVPNFSRTTFASKTTVRQITTWCMKHCSFSTVFAAVPPVAWVYLGCTSTKPMWDLSTSASRVWPSTARGLVTRIRCVSDPLMKVAMKFRSFFAVAVEGDFFAKFLAAILNFWRKFRLKLLGIWAHVFQLGWDLPSPPHFSNSLSLPDKMTLCAESCRQGWWRVAGKNVLPTIYHFIFLLICPPLVRNCSSRVEWNRHHHCLGFEWY